jgi:uncharacterized protein YdhG (YjbR/CyaY superfamily)
MNSIPEYISQFPESTQIILNKLYNLVKTLAPEAEESISYAMPAFKLNNKPLIYFAAFEHHIGLYATPKAHTEFAQELSHYKQGKGSVQFPLDKPIPYDLIERIITFKVNQNYNE